MKNSKKKKLGKNILNGVLSFVKGATTANPIINMAVGAVSGVVKGVQKSKDTNIQSDQGGSGNVDVPGMIGMIGGMIIIIGGAISVANGWLTIDDVKEFIKIWEKTQ